MVYLIDTIMRQFRTIKLKPKFKVNIETTNVVLRESSPIDVFYSAEVHPKHCENKAICHIDPIIMLFNQERLKRTLGVEQVESWIASLSQNKSNPLAELRAKLTDAELAQLVKSRHIQNPSELWKYAQAMESNIDNFKEEIRSIVEAENAKIAEQAKGESKQEDNSKSSE